MVFNATFSMFYLYRGGHFFSVEETRVHGENHPPAVSDFIT